VGCGGCLAALDEALEGEALEVGVDPQGHYHDLPHETRYSIGPCPQQSIELVTPRPGWGGGGWLTSPWEVRSTRCLPLTCANRDKRTGGGVGGHRAGEVKDQDRGPTGNRGSRSGECGECGGRSCLEAGEGLHEELGLAGVLGEEADGGAHVDVADLDLEDRAALVLDPAVIEGRLLECRGRHEAELDCRRGEGMCVCGAGG
jgi:hypothetical protein